MIQIALRAKREGIRLVRMVAMACLPIFFATKWPFSALLSSTIRPFVMLLRRATYALYVGGI